MTTQADVIVQALADCQATAAALRRQLAEATARLAERTEPPEGDARA